MTKMILPYFPEHLQYCEPFFGGGSMFFAKEPCPHETINDLDEGVATFFRVLRDNGEEFIERASLTEYGEALYNDCRATWCGEQNEVVKAWKWWIVAMMSFSGNFGSSHGHTRIEVRRGMPQRISAMFGRVERLPEIVERLQRTQVLCGDAIRVMKCCDTPDCLHYIDPPYVHSTRRAGSYAHEMDDAQHEELLDCLLNVEGYVVLSGYANEMYDKKLGWQRLDHDVIATTTPMTCDAAAKNAGKRGDKRYRVESIWLNPRTVEALHGSEPVKTLSLI